MPFEIQIHQDHVRPLRGKDALGLPRRLITARRIAYAPEELVAHREGGRITIDHYNQRGQTLHRRLPTESSRALQAREEDTMRINSDAESGGRGQRAVG